VQKWRKEGNKDLVKKVDVNNLDDLRTNVKVVEVVKLQPQSVYNESAEVEVQK
jgi:hypothetical protein